jgi:hypothetical protein
MVLSTKHPSKKVVYFFFFLLALYLGDINSTKVPLSDQVMYQEAFKLVPHRNLWQNLTGIYGLSGGATTKEMGYGLFNIIGYYVSLGVYPLFILLGTTLIYMLYYDAIYQFYNYIKKGVTIYYIVAAVLTLSFFTQFFNLTIHLERQYLATTFTMYALVRTIVTHRIPWILLILAATLHTSTGVFLPLFLLRQFKKNLSLKWTFIIIGGLCVIMASLNFILGAFLSGDSDVYAVQRLQDMDGEGREERMSTSLVLLAAVPLYYITLKNLLFYRHLLKRDEVLIFMFYLFITIFALANPNNTMQYRFFMMSYSFIPFILPLLFRKDSLVCRSYLVVISAFMVLRFYLTFEQITFTYAPVEDVIFENFFGLFDKNNI